MFERLVCLSSGGASTLVYDNDTTQTTKAQQNGDLLHPELNVYDNEDGACGRQLLRTVNKNCHNFALLLAVSRSC